MPQLSYIAWRRFFRCVPNSSLFLKFELQTPEDLDRTLQSLDSRTSITTYASLLRQVGVSKCLQRAKWLHSHIVRHNKDSGAFLGNYLIEMYGACNSIDDAAVVFANMRERNVFTWTIMIKAFAQNGCFLDALECYKKMDVTPTKVTFVCVLGACASLGSKGLEDGRKIHARVVDCGIECDLTLANTLVNMFGKCGSIKDAKAVFDGIRDKDVVSWNSMIEAYVSCGCPADAIQLYGRMKMGQGGATPNVVTFVSLLGACSNLGNAVQGKQIHDDIRTCKLESNAVLASKLVTMYSKCKRIDYARAVFESMATRVVVSWNAMIAAYAQNGQCREALWVFRRMELDGTKPDETTFVSVLSSCCSCGDLSTAKEIETRILDKYGTSSKSLCSVLVNFYGKLGHVEEAERVFRLHDGEVAAWNSMLAAYAQNGQRLEAFELFESMKALKPNEVTFLNVLGACSSLRDVTTVHERWEAEKKSCRNLDDKEKVENALITCYARCGSLESASQVFERMQQRSVVSWSSMIAAYTQLGFPREAIEMYKRMDVKPDEYTLSNAATACAELGDLTEAKAIHKQVNSSEFAKDASIATAMLTMFAKCGSLEDALAVFSAMETKDVVPWSAMVSACAHCGLHKEALSQFHRMDLEGVRPNAITFVSVVEACTVVGNPVLCKLVHDRVTSSGHDTYPILKTALINMYSKCGIALPEAFKGGGSVEDGPHQWTAMITACSHHGTPQQALQLLQEMELHGVQPDVVTLLSVLAACGHAGMLKQGWHYFAMLSLEYGLDLEVDHYGCLVDLLGRAGWLDEADYLISNMPCEPDVVAWTSFLGACKMHGDTERAEFAASKLVELSKEAGPFSLMLNTRLEEFRRV